MRFVLALVLLACSGVLQAVPPNIVLILADDMGYGDLGCYGHPRAKTPHIDRLAKEGVRFTQHYSNGTECSPTRTALLTGRYPWRARMKHWVLFGVQGDPLIEEDRPTLATLFRSQGYATAMVGKWHLGFCAWEYTPTR